MRRISPLPFRGGGVQSRVPLDAGGVSPAGAASNDRPHPNPSPEGEGLRLPLLLLAALVTLTAGHAAAQSAQPRWYRVFADGIERAMGRSVRVDLASIAPGGLGRQFVEADVLLRKERGHAPGTAFVIDRSVDCARGRAMTLRTRVLAPTGALLGEWTNPSPQPQAVFWDAPDGKVLRFVCRGVPAR